ncbi:MAG: DUF6232 family protein [Hyphomicrobium sp.]
MSSSLAFTPMPQPWSVSETTGTTGRPRRILRIGAREIAVDDIESVAVERVTTRDIQGLTVMAMAFALLSATFLIGVAQFGWLTRFMVGCTFLAALALASLWDILGIHAITYQRMHIRTRRGATLVFTSADAHQITALAMALGLTLPTESRTGKNGATGALQVE